MAGLLVPFLLDPAGARLRSLRDINRLAADARERIYGRLVPEAIFTDFGIDPESFCGSDGRRQVSFICPPGLGLLRIEVRLRRRANGNAVELLHIRLHGFQVRVVGNAVHLRAAAGARDQFELRVVLQRGDVLVPGDLADADQSDTKGHENSGPRPGPESNESGASVLRERPGTP